MQVKNKYVVKIIIQLKVDFVYFLRIFYISGLAGAALVGGSLGAVAAKATNQAFGKQ